MRAMILAAGFGTRFRPVTHTLPKPMIPVLNRPLLAWAVEACLEAGYHEIIINLHHLSGAIRSYLDHAFGDQVDFELSEEEEILGTGGALRNVRHLLGEDFVLMNGDTIQWPPFGDLVKKRKAHAALACLLLRHAPDGESFTSVWLDGWRITGFGEGRGEPFMFAGAHALSKSIIDLLPDRAFSGLTNDVYMPVVDRGVPPMAGFLNDDLWFDVGTPVRYMEATHSLLRAMREGVVSVPGESQLTGGNALRHRSSEIRGRVDASSIGSATRIGKGAELVRSVVWDDVTIGAGSSISDSIIAHGVDLPEGSLIQNAVVVRAPDVVGFEEDVERIGKWRVREVDPSRPWTFRAG